jgi:hypothetical protein
MSDLFKNKKAKYEQVNFEGQSTTKCVTLDYDKQGVRKKKKMMNGNCE